MGTAHETRLPRLQTAGPGKYGDGLGRGGHGTGSERRLGRQEVQDRGDRWGEGERGDRKNTLPLGGRVLVHVRLYGERGRGGG